MIGALRLDGTTACMAIAGATDTEVFRAYVDNVLCPMLRPGEVVVMDNLAPHKSDPPLELIMAAGAQALFLPAYSPDLNPIEKDVEQSQSAAAQRRGAQPGSPRERHRWSAGQGHRPRCPRLVRLVWL